MSQNLAIKTINKFPGKHGLLLFGISMSRIENAQSASMYAKYIDSLVYKITKAGVGAIFIYSDSLYLYSDERAANIKNKLSSSMITHAQGVQRWIEKNNWYNSDAFSFYSWNQILLTIGGRFLTYFGELKKIYHTDTIFQRCVKNDIGTELPSDMQVNFILEEILVFYLISKSDVPIYNKFIANHDKWRLWCYPGEPLKSEIYLYQRNFFKLANSNNIFEDSFLNLENNLLYDFQKLDLVDNNLVYGE